VAPLGTFTGDRFAVVPPADLGFGSHQLRVLAADRSGNAMAPAVWSFSVVDVTAPTLADPRPDDGSSGSDRTPTISIAAADAGTGVDPSSLQVLVDGSDVTSWGDFDGSRFRYAPGDLGAGVHTISVTVADRAGNVAGPLMWQFAVANPATLRLNVAAAP